MGKGGRRRLRRREKRRRSNLKFAAVLMNRAGDGGGKGQFSHAPGRRGWERASPNRGAREKNRRRKYLFLYRLRLGPPLGRSALTECYDRLEGGRESWSRRKGGGKEVFRRGGGRRCFDEAIWHRPGKRSASKKDRGGGKRIGEKETAAKEGA